MLSRFDVMLWVICAIFGVMIARFDIMFNRFDDMYKQSLRYCECES